MGKIAQGVKQPGQLRRSIHRLTKKVMYQRLKKLERYKIIQRKKISDKPLKVYYLLTPLGKKIDRLIKVIKNID